MHRPFQRGIPWQVKNTLDATSSFSRGADAERRFQSLLHQKCISRALSLINETRHEIKFIRRSTLYRVARRALR